jgi:hypothetical protein
MGQTRQIDYDSGLCRRFTMLADLIGTLGQDQTLSSERAHPNWGNRDPS